MIDFYFEKIEDRFLVKLLGRFMCRMTLDLRLKKSSLLVDAATLIIEKVKRHED